MIQLVCQIGKEKLTIEATLDQTPKELISSSLQLDSEEEIQFKIIYKGKQLVSDVPFNQTFTKDDTSYKVLVVISHQAQISQVQSRDIRHQDALKNYARMVASRPKHTIVHQGYFKTIEPLPNFSDIEKARDLLIKLRDDYAIKQIMKDLEWRVTVLKELDPSEKTILGYNQNKGQIIGLRLRLDDYTGFRPYLDIVKVLLHELAHMVFSDHDEKFHKLDRELNAMYQNNKGFVLNKTIGPRFTPSSEETMILGTSRDGIRLGTNSAKEKKLIIQDGDDQRTILANAVLSRLTKEEQEMEKSCGVHK